MHHGVATTDLTTCGVFPLAHDEAKPKPYWHAVLDQNHNHEKVKHPPVPL